MLPNTRISGSLKSGLYLDSSNKLHPHNVTNGGREQHLVVISEDTIEEGDWFLMNRLFIRQCKVRSSKIVTDTGNGRHSSSVCKKIVASTDTTLRIYEPCIQCDGTGETVFSGTYTTQKKCDVCSQLKYPNTRPLPQLSTDFIRKYIEYYNENEPVTEVVIEYEAASKDYQTWMEDSTVPPFHGNLKLTL